jgi:hypothetical protein
VRNGWVESWEFGSRTEFGLFPLQKHAWVEQVVEQRQDEKKQNKSNKNDNNDNKRINGNFIGFECKSCTAPSGIVRGRRRKWRVRGLFNVCAASYGSVRCPGGEASPLESVDQQWRRATVAGKRVLARCSPLEGVFLAAPVSGR